MTRASPFKRPAPWAPTTCLVTRICEICLANRGRERATPQILGVGPETVLRVESGAGARSQFDLSRNATIAAGETDR
jgi:hypothetical protein